MFTLKKDDINQALRDKTPVFFRQVGGITWMTFAATDPNFELFEYWIGEDYPRDPESVTKSGDELLRARKAVTRFLIAYGRHIEGDWYEFLAHEVGLDLDSIGMIAEPTGDYKHRGEFKPKGIHAP